MRYLIPFVLAFAILSSCEKIKGKKGDFEFPCDVSTCMTCGDNSYDDPNKVGSDVKVYFVEPITYDNDGICKIAGYVKYLKNGKTVALVKYGYNEKGSYGIKTNCVNGDCEDKNATTCTFSLECNKVVEQHNTDENSSTTN